ncbi:DUF5916 domain-containing protein [Mucilaginibacter boryungensis]|uniref:Carbohydrate binding family 9 domain-containing protein n=1 Tax=Mucilaginibacter boryungensis TaxID=768480 RepID=A0ABR9XNE0_9SPHI|nr:DUF5916 domain-containing protein [Mucilaginibacter boryungensis]MBE9668795.1 carbohydrate binding family 9 domain-containing protein [Mucilaginibacter boryungensis]
MKTIFGLCLSCLTVCVFAQAPVKKLEAIKVTTPPKIDGVLDDDVWKNAPIATDFVENNPVAGRHEKNEERTEVKIAYDNAAIYVAARMHETSAGKVARELTTRDNIANDDYFGMILDTYLDGINGTGFYVTAAGVQFDAKYIPAGSGGSNEDGSWNGVWESNVKVDEHGWTAEFKIPYSALRFGKKDAQTWGLNFIRKRQSEQKQLFWNELDPKKNGLMNQEGQLTGLKSITPPLRLAFYPYFSTYLNHYPYNTAGVKNTTGSVNGGMDVKYGINQSFTLDVTLIPDFGQVQSDNKVLNLTPFEVKYTENRPFFTEGTELFNKGNLFYSRRIGGSPIDYGKAYDGLKPTESVISNPSETRLLNATKISGRLSNGLGIGFFNAITNSANAIVEDANGNRREVETSPLTNYNILVLDQNLKNNSAVTLINTNVDRFGKDYNADVGGVVFNLNNKKNSYNINGYGMMSNLFYHDQPTVTGYSYELSFAKTQGSFTGAITQDLVDDKYNQNDLGILFNNNYLNHNLNLQYFIYKPSKLFNQWGVFANAYYSRRLKESAYQNLNLNVGSYFRFKNNWQSNINLNNNRSGNDFYEPRVAGRYYRTSGDNNFNFNLNTNSNTRLHGGIYFAYRVYNRFKGRGYDGEVSYNYRISNKFSFGEDVTYMPRLNNAGFSTMDTLNNNPIFARRNVQTLENIFNIKYTFNNVAGLSFRLRHYWSKLNNKEFFDLAQNGELANLTSNHFDTANDQNYNVWNIDMIYEWQFSPGSVLSLAWKSSSLTNTNMAKYGYFNNFDNTFNQPKNNNYSIKVLYYIDYQNLKKKRG